YVPLQDESRIKKTRGFQICIVVTLSLSVALLVLGVLLGTSCYNSYHHPDIAIQHTFDLTAYSEDDPFRLNVSIPLGYVKISASHVETAITVKGTLASPSASLRDAMSWDIAGSDIEREYTVSGVIPDMPWWKTYIRCPYMSVEIGLPTAFRQDDHPRYTLALDVTSGYISIEQDSTISGLFNLELEASDSEIDLSGLIGGVNASLTRCNAHLQMLLVSEDSSIQSEESEVLLEYQQASASFSVTGDYAGN
ncbi:hypothetical protein KIPB_006724, partial [Kipferlia bialata]